MKTQEIDEIEQEEITGYQPDVFSGRDWFSSEEGKFVERYLHSYLILFKMQYDEILQLHRMLVRALKKQNRGQGKLLKEIKTLNSVLSDIMENERQLSFEFASVRKRVETMILRMNKQENKQEGGEK